MDILNNTIDEISEDLINDIIDIVKIPSVEGKSENGFPFGENVASALNKALKISQKLGFNTNNLDNYIGYAEYGEGEEYIGIIGHVDVVAEGEGWVHDPYGGEIENKKIYGRGVLDNKGPIMCALYGLYAIKKSGLELSKKVRIIFGTNEETGFKDIPYYLKNEIPPIMGFTPDCKYPVVYGEKGMAKLKITNENIVDKNEFLNYIDKLSDKVIVTFKEIEKVNDKLILNLKVKYDFSYKLDDVLNELKNNLGKDINIEVESNYNPIYFDKDSKLVRGLQKAYEKVTNLDGTPVTTNGGTYAKVMPNIVPFGPSFPGQKG